MGVKVRTLLGFEVLSSLGDVGVCYYSLFSDN